MPLQERENTLRSLPGMSYKFQPREVRLIGSDGTQQGVVTLSDAFKRADDVGLDLVCVAPKSHPPVCKIIDHGKYKYEKKKSENEAKKKQHVVQLKEVKLRPKIGNHDLEVKLKNVRKFIGEGNRVKISMRFRGREHAHREVGADIIKNILKDLEDICKPYDYLRQEGRDLMVIVVPLPKP